MFKLNNKNIKVTPLKLMWCFCKVRFPLGDKWRYLAITFRRYFTIILKTSVIRFIYIESEFWSSFDIMSGSEEEDILFLQLVCNILLFKLKNKKRRKRKIWVRELFRKWEEKGAFNNLIQKMKLADRESFFR